MGFLINDLQCIVLLLRNPELWRTEALKPNYLRKLVKLCMQKNSPSSSNTYFKHRKASTRLRTVLEVYIVLTLALVARSIPDKLQFLIFSLCNGSNMFYNLTNIYI